MIDFTVIGLMPARHVSDLNMVDHVAMGAKASHQIPFHDLRVIAVEQRPGVITDQTT